MRHGLSLYLLTLYIVTGLLLSNTLWVTADLTNQKAQWGHEECLNQPHELAYPTSPRQLGINAVRIKIIHTGSIRGSIFPSPKDVTRLRTCYNEPFDSKQCVGGCPRRLSFMDILRENHPDVYFLDSGSYFFGSVTHTLYGMWPSILCSLSTPNDIVALGGSDMYAGMDDATSFVTETTKQRYSVSGAVRKDLEHTAFDHPSLRSFDLHSTLITSMQNAAKGSTSPRAREWQKLQLFYPKPKMVSTNLDVSTHFLWDQHIYKHVVLDIPNDEHEQKILVLSVIQEFFRTTIGNLPSWFKISPDFSHINHLRKAISHIRNEYPNKIRCIVLLLQEDRDFGQLSDYLELEHVNLILVSKRYTVEEEIKKNIYNQDVLIRPITHKGQSLDFIDFTITENNNIVVGNSHVYDITHDVLDKYYNDYPEVERVAPTPVTQPDGTVVDKYQLPEHPMYEVIYDRFNPARESTTAHPIATLLTDVDGDDGSGFQRDTFGCRSATCPMGLLLNDAMLNLCQLHSNDHPCDISFFNAGTIRDSFLLADGKVTLSHIHQALPFSNSLVTFEMLGSDIPLIFAHSIAEGISSRFAQSNIRWVFFPYIDTNGEATLNEALTRVMDFSIPRENGFFEELDPDRYYKIITFSYIFEGNDGYGKVLLPSKIKNSVTHSDTITSSLITYLAKQKLVWAPSRGSMQDCLFNGVPFPPQSRCLNGYSNVTAQEYHSCRSDVDFCEAAKKLQTDPYYYSYFTDEYEYAWKPTSTSNSSNDSVTNQISSTDGGQDRQATNDDNSSSLLQIIRSLLTPSASGFTSTTKVPPEFPPPGDCDVCSGYGYCQSHTCICTINAGKPNEIIAGKATRGLFKGIQMVEGQSCNQLRAEWALSPLVLTVIILFGVVGIVICLVWAVLLVYYRKKPLIKAISVEMSLVMCLGGIVSCASTFTSIPTIKTHFLCNMDAVLLYIGFIILYSAIFSKAYRIHSIFNATTLSSIPRNSPFTTRLTMLALIFIELVLLLLHYIISPFNPAVLELNSFTFFRSCVVGGNVTIINIALLLYNGFILSWGVYLSVKTRKVEANFNESNTLALSLYNIIFTMVIYFLAAFSIRLNPSLTKVIETVCISLASAGTLTIMFSGRFRMLSKGQFEVLTKDQFDPLTIRRNFLIQQSKIEKIADLEDQLGSTTDVLNTLVKYLQIQPTRVPLPTELTEFVLHQDDHDDDVRSDGDGGGDGDEYSASDIEHNELKQLLSPSDDSAGRGVSTLRQQISPSTSIEPRLDLSQDNQQSLLHNHKRRSSEDHITERAHNSQSPGEYSTHTRSPRYQQESEQRIIPLDFSRNPSAFSLHGTTANTTNMLPPRPATASAGSPSSLLGSASPTTSLMAPPSSVNKFTEKQRAIQRDLYRKVLTWRTKLESKTASPSSLAPPLPLTSSLSSSLFSKTTSNVSNTSLSLSSSTLPTDSGRSNAAAGGDRQARAKGAQHRSLDNATSPPASSSSFGTSIGSDHSKTQTSHTFQRRPLFPSSLTSRRPLPALAQSGVRPTSPVHMATVAASVPALPTVPSQPAAPGLGNRGQAELPARPAAPIINEDNHQHDTGLLSASAVSLKNAGDRSGVKSTNNHHQDRGENKAVPPDAVPNSTAPTITLSIVDNEHLEGEGAGNFSAPTTPNSAAAETTPPASLDDMHG